MENRNPYLVEGLISNNLTGTPEGLYLPKEVDLYKV